MQGETTRKVARIIGSERETVAKYWKEYQEIEREMSMGGADVHENQEAICEKAQYKARKGAKKKYTAEDEGKQRSIVESERQKVGILGAKDKQALTNRQI